MRVTPILLSLLLAAPALAQDRPPPKPNDPDDFVRYIFEVNDCVLTEAQLLKLYTEAGHGMMGANNAVIAVSERRDVEVINCAPFTYRFVGSPYCDF